MAFVDIAIVGILLVSTLIGLFRGFVKEALSLVSWIIAVWLAYEFTPQIVGYLEPYIDQSPLRYLAAFSGLFIVTLLIISMVGYVIYRIFSLTGVSSVDRSLGFVFGFIRGVILISLLILSSIFMDFTTQPWWKEAILVELFDPATDFIRSLLPEDLAKFVGQEVA